MNLIESPCIDVATRKQRCGASFPQLYALLMADEVEALPALRPHQRQALHCFLAQVGAMALLAAGESEPPRDAARWADLLRALAPGFEYDEPWSLLVDDLSKPAFMQPPIPEGTWQPLREREDTPDALDMLVTSKNHDVKATRITAAQAQHWIFALITLQTCEGFLGRGNYGISRMNGGFASRPFVGAAPAQGWWGAHLRRDITALVSRRESLLESNALHAREGGLRLLWLEPWDGHTALSPSRLDPYYVEICRRIRLQSENGQLVAYRGNSGDARVDQPKVKHQGKEHTLPTGDPWTPIESAASKPLTVDGNGFHYRRVVNILDEGKFAKAPLQVLGDDERNEAAELVLVATVRGQGETQGYHERRLLVPPRAVPFVMRRTPSPRLSTLAKERVQDVADLSTKALRPALFTLFQSAPEKIDYKDPKAKGKAETFIAAFERAVDADFFEHLFAEVSDEPYSEPAIAKRRAWILLLERRARDALAAAEAGSPLSHVRRYRARAAAEGLLAGAIRKTFADYFKGSS